MQTLLYELSNGLRVVLRPQRTAPVVSLAVWVHVGSADERPEEAGLAHVHEHMLFKGTATRGVGEIARAIEASGGYINAFTSFDETVYYTVLSSRFFDVGLDVLADALQRSSFDAGELERERLVILEEISRGEDSPSQVAFQELLGLTFAQHPYALPVIGTRASVSGFTRDDVLAFFHRWYVASNMTLVVVGDFDLDHAKEAVERLFGGAPTVPRPARPRPEPSRQPGARAVISSGDTTELHLSMTFPGPAQGHEDIPALDLLRVLLGYGETSLLVERLDRDLQLVGNADASALLLRDPGAFTLGASWVHQDEHPGPAEVLAQMLDVVSGLGRHPIDPDHLARAKTLLESSQVYQRQSVEGQGMALGHYVTSPHGLETEEWYYRRLRELRAQDVAEVARRMFTPEHLSISLLVPRALEGTFQAEELLGAAMEGLGGLEFVPGPRALETDPWGMIRVPLEGGPTLLLQPDASVEMLSIRASFLAGVRYETPQNSGISSLLTSLWSLGTSSRSYADVARELEELGSWIEGAGGRNTISLQMDALSAHRRRALQVFADTLRNPAFPEDELERDRRLVLEDLQVVLDSPGTVASRLLLRSLFHPHPYSMIPQGTPDSVKSLTRDDLVAFYRQHIQPDRMALAVVGHMDPEQIVREVEERMAEGGWLGSKPQDRAVPAVPPMPKRERPTLITTQLPKQQAHLLLAFPCAPLGHPDRNKLEILSGTLSGQGGRLFVELRDRQSLAYSVSSYVALGLDAGYFALNIATSPEKIEQAARGLMGQLARLRDEAIPQAEFERVRTWFLGNHDIHYQSFGSRAATMALDELYGLGYDAWRRYPDELASIQPDGLQALAQRTFDPSKACLVVVRPQGAAMPDLSDLGLGDPQEVAAESVLRYPT